MARIPDDRFGHVIVGGQEQSRDAIVRPGRAAGDRWRAQGHRLASRGWTRPGTVVLELLRGAEFEAEALPAHEAVRRYRRLDPTRTATALRLTC